MATLTGAVQLALFAATGSTTHITSSGVTIYAVDNQQYEYVDDFSDGGDYLVINDEVSRVFLNDQLGSSIITGDDAIYIAATDSYGNNNILAGDGNNTITLSSGADAVRVGHGNNIIDTGAGNDTITAGDGNNIIIAGEGNDLITVGKGNNIISAGDGNDVVKIVGNGSGTNYIDAGKGNDKITLATGTGVDTIVKGSVSGEIDTVTGFDTAHDKIAQAASTVSSTVISGNDTVVTFSDGSQVVLVGVQIADSSSFLVQIGNTQPSAPYKRSGLSKAFN